MKFIGAHVSASGGVEAAPVNAGEIGANAFASVGATGSISMVFTSLCLGIAIGAGIVIAQFYGAGDEAGTASAIRNGSII